MIKERRNVVVRLLRRRFGIVPQEMVDQIGTLSDARLDELVDAVLDFQQLPDVHAWLATQH